MVRADLPLEAPSKKRKPSYEKAEEIRTQKNTKTHIDNMLPADLDSVALAASRVSCK